jgi:hypothetical protein
MEAKLMKFWQCVREQSEPSIRDFPSIYHPATVLAKNNYNFSELNSDEPRKVFPPRVYSILVMTRDWEVISEGKKTNYWRLAIKALFVLSIGVVLMSYLPIVE